MATAPKTDERWTAREFLEWVIEQEGKFELIDGVPVEMMAGGKRAHAAVIGNINRSFGNQLAGRGCRSYATDFAVTTGISQVRYPDIVVDCGDLDSEDLDVSQAVLIVEVLSNSTRYFDIGDKLAEYRALPDLRYVLFVSPDFIDVELHHRANDGEWSRERIIDPDHIIDLPEIRASLSVANIYEDLSVEPPTRSDIPANRLS